MPGWNDIVKPFKETASFRHAIWSCCGKLRHGEAFNVMKRTKNQYHQIIWRVKRLKNYLKNCKMVEGCANDSEIFENIKNSRKDTNKVSANVEGLLESKAAELFASKYSELFNSVDDNDKMKKVGESVEKEIGVNEDKACSYITEDLISEATSWLNNDKSDPFSDLTTNCFKEAPPLLHPALVHFYRACLTHNYVPGSILIAMIMPLVKDPNGDICSAENYRSIAL